jgi:transcriptional regulator with XRE-family HTH domain
MYLNDEYGCGHYRADISSNTVAKLELDDTPNPTIETLQKIAKALNVRVDDLIK